MCSEPPGPGPQTEKHKWLRKFDKVRLKSDHSVSNHATHKHARPNKSLGSSYLGEDQSRTAASIYKDTDTKRCIAARTFRQAEDVLLRIGEIARSQVENGPLGNKAQHAPHDRRMRKVPSDERDEQGEDDTPQCVPLVCTKIKLLMNACFVATAQSRVDQ
jgi:hypothetical protein